MKFVRLFILALAAVFLASAQNAALMPMPRLQFFDGSGAPLAGGQVYTYAAGSTAPLATYTDASATVANPNPVLLDAGGFGSIWLGASAYKIVLADAAGVTVWTQDNVSNLGLLLKNGALSGNLSLTGNFSVPGTLAVTGAATFAGTASFSGAASFGASASFSGSVTAQAFGPVLQAALFAGADLGAKINAAIAACPSTGCTIALPSGASTITTQIAVSRANVRLQGQGRGATVLVQAFTGDLVRVTADNFALSGVTLNGNGVSTGWSLVHGVSANKGHIADCELIDSRAPAFNTLLGVRIEGATAAPANDWEVDHCTFTSIPWIGVSVANNANRNAFHHNRFLNGGEAFDFNGVGTGAQIYDNAFTDNFVSGGLGDSFLESAAGSLVRGNVFDFSSATTGYPMIAIHVAASGVQKRTILSGNQFRGGAGSANCLYLYDNADQTLIDANQFDSCGANAIYASTGAGSVVNLTITNNLFRNSGASNAAGGYSAIQVQQISSHAIAYWTVANNVTYDDQATPTQTYGFQVLGTGAAYMCYLHGNDFSRNKTGAISFASTPHSSTVIGPNKEYGTGALTMETAFAFPHPSGGTSTPTVAAGAGAGTSPTGPTVAGNDAYGTVSLTTGTTPSTFANVLTVTFASPYPSTARCVVSPTSQFASSTSYYYYVTGNANGFSIQSNGGSLTASQVYSWNYACGY